MICNQIQELILTDYIDGEITAELKDQVDLHVSECQECRNLLYISLETLQQPFTQTEQKFEGEEKVWQNIKSQIEEEQTVSVKQPVWESWMNGLKIIFSAPRTGVAFSVVFIVFLTAAVYFRTFAQQNIPVRQMEKIQLIGDVADELSNGTDEDKSYGTEIENYFL